MKNWRRPACVCYSRAMKQEHIGSDFDAFLKQEGLLAECEAGALKRVVAWQIEREMKRRRISRAKLASRMKTNRATLDRLLAQNESSVTLQLLEQAALALGRKLKNGMGVSFCANTDPQRQQHLHPRPGRRARPRHQRNRPRQQTRH